APRCEIGQREFDSRVDLLCGHAWRQPRIRKVHRRRIKTDQHDMFHRPSPCATTNITPIEVAMIFILRLSPVGLPIAYEIEHNLPLIGLVTWASHLAFANHSENTAVCAAQILLNTRPSL